MDNSGRENEPEMFDIIRHGEGGVPEGGDREEEEEEEEGRTTDGSEFLNPTGEGMEPEETVEAQTSTDCDDDHNVGPAVTGEVY
jgi:hypothetical protein